MRLVPQTDGLSHDGLVVTTDQHHNQPYAVSISNTSQVIAAGATYNLDVSLGSSDYQFARCQLLGGARMKPGTTGTWRECAEVLVTRDASDAIAHSHRDAGSSIWRVYSVTYSKQHGHNYLTARIFDSSTPTSNLYILLEDAVLTGSVLRLSFKNVRVSGTATLWVKGQAFLW